MCSKGWTQFHISDQFWNRPWRSISWNMITWLKPISKRWREWGFPFILRSLHSKLWNESNKIKFNCFTKKNLLKFILRSCGSRSKENAAQDQEKWNHSNRKILINQNSFLYQCIDIWIAGRNKWNHISQQNETDKMYFFRIQKTQRILEPIKWYFQWWEVDNQTSTAIIKNQMNLQNTELTILEEFVTVLFYKKPDLPEEVIFQPFICNISFLTVIILIWLNKNLYQFI